MNRPTSPLRVQAVWVRPTPAVEKPSAVMPLAPGQLFLLPGHTRVMKLEMYRRGMAWVRFQDTSSPYPFPVHASMLEKAELWKS